MKHFLVLKICLFIGAVFFARTTFAQKNLYSGKLISEEGETIPYAAVRTTDTRFFTQSNQTGNFKISLPEKYKKLLITAVAYDTLIIDLEKYPDGKIGNLILSSSTDIDKIIIRGEGINASGNLRIDAGNVKLLPSVSGNVEDLVKLNLGVIGSRNEMSSQYSVRGGNFDENLVYVNGIEVYRPQLIREGQQEGLSFINPDLVSKVRFSAGGFSARYGDKSASVLDVSYKRARKFGMTASGSLLGANLALEGTAAGNRLTFITGLRYKNTRYMLNAFETKGDYKPSFLDFQSYITWRFNPYWDAGFLINAADNKFNFIPEDKDVYFGTITDIFGMFVDFQGRETDRFTNVTGAIAFNYRPTDYAKYSLNISAVSAREEERFDIIGYYSLNSIQSDFSSENVGDSLLNLGYGMYAEHARNYLDVRKLSINHNSFIISDFNKIEWGASAKYEIISDEIDEWEMLDSAGYSIPYSGENIELYKNIKAENHLEVFRYSAFLQDRILLESKKVLYEILAGMRLNYNTYNEQLLFSPRASAAIKFYKSKNKHKFRIAGGYYYQPPFYKEIRLPDGNLANKKLAQKSLHIVGGYEFNFHALSRDFTMINEVYYKHLDDFTPFELDNVRLLYKPSIRTSGFVKGVDTKIIGDFVVNGAESSFTFSVMQTEEKIKSIGGEAVQDTCGFLPRATDQRISANLFLQDYIPGNKSFKAHLNLVYGTGFPYWSPKHGRCATWRRSTDYKRVDLGASWVLIGKDAKLKPNGFWSNFESLWLTLEVFNLLAVKNTISYSWMLIVPNPAVYGSAIREYAAPNKLSGRRFNLKISLQI